MEAFYYRIIDLFDNEIVDEGVIRHAEDIIYPQQNTGDDRLPFECECHHFEAEGFKCEGWYFDVTMSYIVSNRSESQW